MRDFIPQKVAQLATDFGNPQFVIVIDDLPQGRIGMILVTEAKNSITTILNSAVDVLADLT